jgi:uncharacterized protein (DUF697 family)
MSDEKAELKVHKYVGLAAAVGIVQIPWFDMAALTAVNVKMIKDLADLYHVEFKDQWVKASVSSLLGGVVSSTIGSRIGRYALMAIPVIGPIAGGLSFSVFGAATTYAVGKVFIMHFSTGGTLLDFNPEKFTAMLKEQYEKGKAFVTKPAKSAEPASPEPSPAT